MDPTQPAPPPPPPPGGPQPQGWPAPGPYTSPGGPYTSPGGPYAAGPYGPPGGPGPHGRPPRTTNGLAVGSLVSGIVCCLPPLGLVLGLVALPQIRKRDQAGKGLAIAGIALSALSCLLLVLGLATGGFSAAWSGFKEGVDEAARSKSPFSLRTGQCFTDRGMRKDYTTEITVVDCARPHDGEVTGGFEVTGFDAWPGEDAIDVLAEKRCETTNLAYAMDTWAIPQEVWLFYYLPSGQSWKLGDRTVTCTLATDKKPFSGSLRSDATTLSADQTHFLKYVNPIETAVHREPEEDFDEGFAANRAWAGEVLAALDGAHAGLGEHYWPGASTEPVTALRKDLAAASKRWRTLAAAADSDAYGEAYDAAFDALPGTGDARDALGLTGTPPEGAGTSV
ncbi:DUF4190 domain-containing protein [Streptomyces sp. NPDC088915]|uniref:DUF4190 domain-containing protein n=1 Tax=Streptomyces sp. NPDC088915 TaxID=3365912 RepID=UPI00382DCAE8